jgi:hypothetical protein
MAEYSVRINRREGIVEIEGTDKDWIAEQLKRLAPVYEQPAAAAVTTQTQAPAPSNGGTPTAETPAKPAAPTPTVSRGRRGRGRATRKPELEKALTPDIREALEKYREERSKAWRSLVAQAAIIATFLMDHVGGDWSEGWIDEDDLYTVYNVMGWADGPSNFRSQLSNARQRNGYFGPSRNGRTQLTHGGEKFGRHGSKDAS